MLVSVAKINISKLSQHLGVIYDGISSKDYLKHTHTHTAACQQAGYLTMFSLKLNIEATFPQR